jgi:hypothetical protein
MISKVNWTAEKNKNSGMRDEMRRVEYKLQEKYRSKKPIVKQDLIQYNIDKFSGRKRIDIINEELLKASSVNKNRENFTVRLLDLQKIAVHTVNDSLMDCSNKGHLKKNLGAVSAQQGDYLNMSYNSDPDYCPNYDYGPPRSNSQFSDLRYKIQPKSNSIITLAGPTSRSISTLE